MLDIIYSIMIPLARRTQKKEVHKKMDENNQEFSQVNQTEQRPQQSNNGGSLAIAALVCGILGLVGAFIPGVNSVTWLLAILGIIFGVVSRKTAPPDKRGMATAGMILGIVSLGLHILAIICIAMCAGAIFSGLSSIY